MARKNSNDSTSTEAGGNTGSKSKSAKSSINKTHLVEEALKQKITAPQKISEHLMKEYGVDITPAHVSTIKGNLKKRKGTKRGRPKGSTKKAIAEAAAAAAAAVVAKAIPAPKAGGLTLNDLRTLNEMARKAGGYGQLRELLDVLGDL